MEVKAEVKDALFIKETQVHSKQGDDAKEAGNDNKNVTAYPQTESSSERVIAQKQAGRYAVAYHPIGGMVPAQKFGEIYAVIKDVANAEVRVAPDETLYIINLEEEQAERIHKITADAVSYTHLDVYKRQMVDTGSQFWKPLSGNYIRTVYNTIINPQCAYLSLIHI